MVMCSAYYFLHNVFGIHWIRADDHEFDVSDAWKNKFKILEKAGKFKGVSYEYV